MDPQKDFIHIDEVFKKLRDGEEQERSGAWLHMKDLLDKEMPVGSVVSAGKSFRRYIIPLLALLLVGSGTATYYSLTQNKKEKSAGVQIATATSGSEKMARSLTSAATASKNPSRNTLTSSKAKPTTPQSGNVSEMGTNISNTNLPRQSSSKIRTVIIAKNSSKSRHSDKDKNAAIKNPTEPLTPVTSKEANSKHSQKENRSNGNNIAAHTTGSSIIEEQNIIEEIKPGAGSSAKNTKESDKSVVTHPMYASAKPSLGSKNKSLTTKLLQKKIVQTPDGNMYKEERDTFKRIDILERYTASSKSGKNSSMQTRLDTIAITRIEKIRYIPLTKMELLALQKMKISHSASSLVPMAGLKERTLSKEWVSLVPLTKYKVSSRKVDPGKFNELIKSTTSGIANYFDGSHSFYAAFLVGGNTSIGNPGALGIQMGIAGLYSLSERIALAAEFKFANHYLSNYTIEDHSVSYENIKSQQISGSQWLFSGMEYTQTSSYKLNSYNTLEIPLTLNYNLGRVTVFGGINLAYAFPMNWSKQTSLNSVAVEYAGNQNKVPFANTPSVLDENKAFTSRMGAGYVAGMNYDFSRKISLDARVTQILTDNAKGNTDAVNRLFRMPNLQISIGYYFGRKEKITYIMDRK